MRSLVNSGAGRTVALVLFLAATTAYAEDLDPLEAEAAAALLDAEEDKKPKPKSTKDPDAKLLKEVDTARTAMEKRLNVLQSKSQKFADIQEGLNELSQTFLAASDEYFSSHGDAVDAYQTAEVGGDKKVIKLTSKRVIKIRKKLLKTIKSLEKSFKKLEKLEKKLSKQAAEEDAEAAKRAAKAPAKKDENKDEDDED